MFGTLACMRHLLNKLDFKEIAKCQRWVQFVWKLLLTCRELSNVVAVVVNNSSPEGISPNDFSIIENSVYDEDVEMESLESTVDEDITNEAETFKNTRTTPQMVLLCSWRTIKEVSLILGDIVFTSPIMKTPRPIVKNQNDQVGLISCDQVVQIGAHFTDLLSETKHRGAFEQAYVGFSKLCIRLWGSQHVELHQLPMKWLQEMISAINSNSKHVIKSEKISPTRRSAGIPYMMQALITSETQVSSTKGIQYSMRQLLELCRIGSSSQTRTHSLNILRALFRATDLGDSIGEFIAEGFECAINGYDAESWSVSGFINQ